uniref:Secreted protein n=1 Tax=Achlya hypogyna TaxID=1202772 RepID=A0A0A7CNK6_ACHHY|nr:secreted protein [Achlya hypogyna]
MRWFGLGWVLAAVTAFSSKDAVLEELARTDARLVLYEHKLTLLSALRQQLHDHADDELPAMQAELQDILARLKVPHTPKLSTTPTPVALLTERPLQLLPSAPVLVHTYRVPHVQRSLLLSITVTAMGDVCFAHLPGGQAINTLPLREPAVAVTAAAVDTDVYPAKLYAVFADQSLGTFNVTYTYDAGDGVYPAVGELSMEATDLPPVLSVQLTTAQGQRLLLAATSSAFHAIGAGSVKTVATTKAVVALLPHRHVVAVPQGTAVDIHHILKLGDGPASVYACSGGLAPVASVAFDVTVVSRMYAATTTGDIYTYDVFHANTRTCRAVARVATGAASPLRLRAVGPGFLVAVSSSHVLVFQTTASGGLQLLGGATHDGGETPVDGVVSVVPSFHNGDFWEDALIVVGVGHSVRTFQASLHLHQETQDSGGLLPEGPWNRVPLVFVVVVAVLVYKLWWAKPSSVLPRAAAFDNGLRVPEDDDEYRPPRRAYVPPNDEQFASAQKVARQRHEGLQREVY